MCIRDRGYKYSTRAAMTVSISDMTVPPQKPEMIKQAQDTVDRITKNYKRGLITEEERYKEVVDTWKKTDDELTKALLTGLDKMCIRDRRYSMRIKISHPISSRYSITL